jgi:hypothetical protein
MTLCIVFANLNLGPGRGLRKAFAGTITSDDEADTTH